MSTAADVLWSEADEHQLAALLLSPSGRHMLDGALEKVSPEDFYDPHFGVLWQSAQAITTAGGRISKRTLLAEKDTPAVRARLDAITGATVSGHRVSAAITTVREYSQRRRLVQAAERIVDQAMSAEDYSQAHERSMQMLAALDGGHTSAEIVSFAALGERWSAEMARQESATPVIPTPWPGIDEVLVGGLHAGRVYLVAGRPGSGKSLAGLNLAQCAAERGNPTLVFSAEMGGHEVTSRLLASGGQVEYAEMTRRAMSPETDLRAREYLNTNRDMPLHLVDRANITTEYIASTARTFKRQHGLGLLVVDYLQLLSITDRSVIREQQVAHISRSMKLLSRELDCAVVVLAQLNRGNTRENRRPSLADLRESGSLEQDADVVVLLHHEPLEDGSPSGEVHLILGKNRTGRTGDVTLGWRAYQARIG